MDVSPGHSVLLDVRHTKSQCTNDEKFTTSVRTTLAKNFVGWARPTFLTMAVMGRAHPTKGSCLRSIPENREDARRRSTYPFAMPLEYNEMMACVAGRALFH